MLAPRTTETHSHLGSGHCFIPHELTATQIVAFVRLVLFVIHCNLLDNIASITRSNVSDATEF